MKKLTALFMTLALIFGAFNASCIASATGAYGDNFGSIEDSIIDISLESKDYPVKKGIVYAYPGLTAAQLISTYNKDDGDISVTNNQQVVTSTAALLTGAQVNLTCEDVVVDTAALAVLGDVYIDGFCNVTDITTIINSILDKSELSEIQTNAADTNRSGKLTVADVIKMRNIIFNSADYACLSPETGLYLTSQYVAGAYDSPMWAGNIVYQENAVVQKNESGGIDDISLLYKIDSIIEVRNYGLNKVYEYGTDYLLTDEGKIRIPEGSTITAAASDAFLGPAKGNWLDTADGKYNVTSYGTNIHNYQISVTYTHSDSWDGFIPQDNSSRLDGFHNKLENGEEVTMLFYGDSISTGLNSSGCNEALKWKYDGNVGYSVYNENYKESINIAPYAASWPRAIYNRVVAKYPDATVNYVNSASSSSNSTTHGTRNLQAAVIDNNPDIVFIAFGTNESGASKANYKSYQKTMLEGITNANSDCAVVFISPTVPNLMKYSSNNFAAFEEAFFELQEEYPELDIAVAPVYKVATYVNSIKKYQDLSGNNINHPNDFGARIYGNTIMQVLGLYN